MKKIIGTVICNRKNLRLFWDLNQDPLDPEAGSLLTELYSLKLIANLLMGPGPNPKKVTNFDTLSY